MYTVEIHCAVHPDLILTKGMARRLHFIRLAAGGFKTGAFADKEALFHYVRCFDYIGPNNRQSNHFLDATMLRFNDPLRHRQPFDSHRSRLYQYFDVGFSKNVSESYYYLGYLTRGGADRVIDLRNCADELYAFDKASYEDAMRRKYRSKWNADKIAGKTNAGISVNTDTTRGQFGD